MWIFGYGSLVWKVDFPYVEKLEGYIKGFSRRFWQANADHRGTPEQPGRVVTLIPSNDTEEKVYGIAYKIAEEDIENVRKHLDYREKNGYEIIDVIFYPTDETARESFHLQLYIGHRSNPFYLGPADEDVIAKQILTSHGQSGPNTEYLFNLAKTMRRIAPQFHDSHLYDIEAQVKQLLTITDSYQK
ncbi:CHAC2 (predicted) [Pycnogonum litorale]